jgi:broad specificity phosphatase PhoE
MTITLIRHAKVLATEDKKLYASEVPKWVKHYNEAPIEETLPKDAVIRQIKRANVVVASSLSRTYDSLALLGVEPSVRDSVFDEAEVPFGKIPYIKLYPRQWLVVLRLMMLVGMGKGSSSFKASKSRAVKAENDLITLAQSKQNIALMGHGGMNWLIAKVLEKEGWSCVEDVYSSKNWGYKVYENHKN